MENKQTAVGWLISQIEKDSDVIFFDRNLHYFDEYVNKAKQKEKEQIIEAWDKACTDQNRIGKEYYQDTYESNN